LRIVGGYEFYPSTGSTLGAPPPAPCGARRPPPSDELDEPEERTELGQQGEGGPPPLPPSLTAAASARTSLAPAAVKGERVAARRSWGEERSPAPAPSATSKLRQACAANRWAWRRTRGAGTRKGLVATSLSLISTAHRRGSRERVLCVPPP
jgi:hypothetical protein